MGNSNKYTSFPKKSVADDAALVSAGKKAVRTAKVARTGKDCIQTVCAIISLSFLLVSAFLFPFASYAVIFMLSVVVVWAVSLVVAVSCMGSKRWRRLSVVRRSGMSDSDGNLYEIVRDKDSGEKFVRVRDGDSGEILCMKKIDSAEAY